MRKKILYYAPIPSDSTSFWRIHGVFPFIHSDEFELVDVSYTTNFNWSTLIGASALIFQRPFTKEHASLISACKDMGIKIICDYDDNLFCVDMFNPTYELYKFHLSTLNDCIRMADELWVSTKAIAEDYKHPNTHIIPNSHNEYLFPVNKKLPFNNNKKVIYRGGGSHKADVFEKSEMLVGIINENKDWTFTFMGDRYEFIEQRTGDNHHIVGGMPIINYFKFLYQENPAIVIFPLCTTRFNASKSNISWMEATYTGAAFFGNTDLSEFNQSGILPFGELEYLMKQEEILNKSNKSSWEYIADNLLLSTINQKRIDRIIANL